MRVENKKHIVNIVWWLQESLCLLWSQNFQKYTFKQWGARPLSRRWICLCLPWFLQINVGNTVLMHKEYLILTFLPLRPLQIWKTPGYPHFHSTKLKHESYSLKKSLHHIYLNHVTDILECTWYLSCLKLYSSCLKLYSPCLKLYSPCLKLHSSCHKLYSPCLILYSSCHKLYSPCHKLYSPCLKLYLPCYKLYSPCLKLYSPCLKLYSPCLVWCTHWAC